MFGFQWCILMGGRRPFLDSNLRRRCSFASLCYIDVQYLGRVEQSGEVVSFSVLIY